jgi:hypothetical protein
MLLEDINSRSPIKQEGGAGMGPFCCMVNATQQCLLMLTQVACSSTPANNMLCKTAAQRSLAFASSGYLPPRMALRRCMALGKFSRVYRMLRIWVFMVISFSARSFSSIWLSCKMHAAAHTMNRAPHIADATTLNTPGTSGLSSSHPLH